MSEANAPEPKDAVDLNEERRLLADKALQALRTAIDAMTPDQRARFAEAQERLASGTTPPLTNREAQRLIEERFEKIPPGEDDTRLSWDGWADYKREIVVRWWREGEAYRDEIAGLTAGAARSAPDPEAAYALWLTWAETPEELAYTEDLIARVRRHLQDGTGAQPLGRSGGV